METNMSNLIKALQIFLKYGDETYPTSGAHDTIYVFYNGDEMSDQDLSYLKELGFEWDEDLGSFSSNLYG